MTHEGAGKEQRNEPVHPCDSVCTRTPAERSRNHATGQTSENRECPRSRPLPQILPNKRRTTRMTSSNPNPPVGAYPQFRLCGQVGIAPTRSKTSRIINTVPSMTFLSRCGCAQPTAHTGCELAALPSGMNRLFRITWGYSLKTVPALWGETLPRNCPGRARSNRPR